METEDLIDIREAAARMTARGYTVSAATLRKWRPTWPNGKCMGPQPLLISTRRLRYRGPNCDEFVDHAFAAAEAAARRPAAD